MNYIMIKNTNYIILDGDRGKNYPSNNDLFSNGYCLFLNNKNIVDNKLSLSCTQFISKSKDAQLKNGKLEFNDIVLTTRGTIGNVLYVDSCFPLPCRINSGMVIIKSISGFDNKFIYYFLTSNFCKFQMKSLLSGAAQPQLPIKDLIAIKLPLYSYREQQHIINTILSRQLKYF